MQLLEGGCTISSPSLASSLFPLSIQHFEQTQNRVLGTHRLRGDYESNEAFQHVTERSRCNYTCNFLCTQKIGKTTWKNDNHPLKRFPSEDRCFPGKTQALGSKACFPCANIPWPSPPQHAHRSCPCVTSPSQHPQTAGCTAGSLPRRLGEAAQSPPHCSPGQPQEFPQCPQSHDCWHGGRRARGAEGFPSLASPHNSGPAKDNSLPGDLRGQAGSGLPRASLL